MLKSLGRSSQRGKALRSPVAMGSFFPVALILLLAAWAASAEAQSAGLYDVFERSVTNSKTYSNPFDFNVIELRTTFTHVGSGRIFSYFGFYDGNGAGGQTGNVWKMRFMPDATGTWNYSWTWTDGTPGGSGSFTCADTGLPGPLKIATDNSWYFMDARGRPFHCRGYCVWGWLTWSATGKLEQEVGNFKNMLQTRVVDRGYNMLMWQNMENRLKERELGAESWYAPHSTDSLWLDTTDTKRFHIPKLFAYDDALRFAQQNRVYAFPWTLIHHGAEYDFADFQVFLRYFVARYGAFYNFLGWSPTWEWMDIWSPDEVNQIMQYVYDIDPWKRLLSAQDNSYSTFTGWLGFSLRQGFCRDVFKGNSRRAGIQQISDPNGSGGIGNPFINKPIIGSEDIWEMSTADNWPNYTMPRDGTEAMRGAWGIQMAGVMPLYDEWNVWRPEGGGTGEGEPHVRRMFDFFYSKTQCRKYEQLNGLVSSSARQVCSGIKGQEYLVYDEDGGSITIDLSDAPASTNFSVLWYNPATGAEQMGEAVSGGTSRTLTSPISGDSVLLLK